MSRQVANNWNLGKPTLFLLIFPATYKVGLIWHILMNQKLRLQKFVGHNHRPVSYSQSAHAGVFDCKTYAFNYGTPPLVHQAHTAFWVKEGKCLEENTSSVGNVTKGGLGLTGLWIIIALVSQ